MKTVYKIFKILVTVVFLVYSSTIVWWIFLAPKESRVKMAEDLQGYRLSQHMFDVLIWQYPDYSEAYMEKSVAYNKRGDYATGFKWLNKAVQLEPKKHLGYRGWLRLMRLKDYEGALQDLQKLKSFTPKGYPLYAWGENVYYLMGICRQGMGQYEWAKKNYEACYRSEKNHKFMNPIIFVYHGNILALQDSLPNALAYYNRAIRYNKESVEAYYYKGLVLKKLNQIDSAKANFTQALQLYTKGYKHKDIYNEVFQEIYREDIMKQLEDRAD